MIKLIIIQRKERGLEEGGRWREGEMEGERDEGKEGGTKGRK